MIMIAPAMAAACNTAGFLGVHLYDRLQCSNDGLVIDSLQDVATIIVNIIRLLLVFGGFIAIVMMIVGGIMYITSTGEPAKIGRAKAIITNAVIGLVIAVSAFAIVSTLSGVFK